jgi:echinoderm microtubule-associated protein-like 6
MPAAVSNSWQRSLGSVLLWSQLTVRPLSSIKLLIKDNQPDPSPPDVNYSLDYVYGYRCEDSRQNVFLNSQGQAVYMTAALGVILDQNSNT